ncbi:MAG: DUF2279 domain-containing protein [Gemmatimonadaceae bacterium]
MKLTFALLLALHGTLAPPPDDGWFSADKIKHFFVAAFVHSLTYSALRSADLDHRDALAAAAVATGAIAVGKELRDMRRESGFSGRDLAWGAAGVAGASLLLDRTRR